MHIVFVPFVVHYHFSVKTFPSFIAGDVTSMKSTDTRQVEKERKPVHRLTPFTLAALGSQKRISKLCPSLSLERTNQFCTEHCAIPSWIHLTRELISLGDCPVQTCTLRRRLEVISEMLCCVCHAAIGILELPLGLEPKTSALQRRCSTN